VACWYRRAAATDERFCSQLFGRAVTRTSALEAVVISAWVRGLSDRDVEAGLAEVLGPEAVLSRSTVSRICAQLKEEFARFGEADRSAPRLPVSRRGQLEDARARPSRAGVRGLGHRHRRNPHLVAIDAASGESTDTWCWQPSPHVVARRGWCVGQPPLRIRSEPLERKRWTIGSASDLGFRVGVSLAGGDQSLASPPFGLTWSLSR
jgi:hypothetical protein